MPLIGHYGFDSRTHRHPHERDTLRMEIENQIVLQLSDSILEQQRMICELARNDLMLIESFHAGEVSPEVLAVAAATVRATLYSVDALSDKLRLLADQARHR